MWRKSAEILWQNAGRLRSFFLPPQNLVSKVLEKICIFFIINENSKNALQEIFMKKIMTIAFVAALAMPCGFLASCASTPSNAQTDADGDWELVSFVKDGVAQSIAPATLSVTEKGSGSYAVSGFSGVNNYSGSLKADGNKIVVAPNLAFTRMAGSQAAMEFESDYLDLLANAESWNVSGKKLSLTGGKAVAQFQKKFLEGSSWKLVGMNTGNAVVSQNGNITLSFKGQKVSGFTGINNVSLGYTADEKARSLSFADGPLTLRAGTEEEAKAERLFLDNLFNTASYSLSGDNLTFYNASGTTLLNFVKR